MIEDDVHPRLMLAASGSGGDSLTTGGTDVEPLLDFGFASSRMLMFDPQFWRLSKRIGSRCRQHDAAGGFRWITCHAC